MLNTVMNNWLKSARAIKLITSAALEVAGNCNASAINLDYVNAPNYLDYKFF